MVTRLACFAMGFGDSKVALVASTAVAVLCAQYAIQFVVRKLEKKKPGVTTVEIRPPFPPEIIALLTSSALCYLSTLSNGAPHLSLMNFTYHPEDEKIIMSTRRNTTKYSALCENKRVAVLIHDFPAEHRTRAASASAMATQAKGDYGQTYSVAVGVQQQLRANPLVQPSRPIDPLVGHLVRDRQGRAGRRGRALPRCASRAGWARAEAVHRRRRHRHHHGPRRQGKDLQPGRPSPCLGKQTKRRLVKKNRRLVPPRGPRRPEKHVASSLVTSLHCGSSRPCGLCCHIRLGGCDSGRKQVRSKGGRLY